MAMFDAYTSSGVITEDSGFNSLPVVPIWTEIQNRWTEASRLDL